MRVLVIAAAQDTPKRRRRLEEWLPAEFIAGADAEWRRWLANRRLPVSPRRHRTLGRPVRSIRWEGSRACPVPPAVAVRDPPVTAPALPTPSGQPSSARTDNT